MVGVVPALYSVRRDRDILFFSLTLTVSLPQTPRPSGSLYRARSPTRNHSP